MSRNPEVVATIEKEHMGRYTARGPQRQTVGHIVNGQVGWIFRDAKGYGPRQPSVTPTRALLLAEIVGFIQPPALEWGGLVRHADETFGHNQKVSRHG